ncbi:MAG: DUF134 domain-containing protein [Firmicutes bacterium]|nr:DUF134 domain-containing protein [Bacillota bacterium]
MPRCKKQRCCRMFGGEIIYKPIDIPCTDLQETVIDLDEFEAMRLCDLEELDQTAAGERMGVSRGTIQRLLTSGRKKLIEALMNSRAIRIQNSSENFKEE